MVDYAQVAQKVHDDLTAAVAERDQHQAKYREAQSRVTMLVEQYKVLVAVAEQAGVSMDLSSQPDSPPATPVPDAPRDEAAPEEVGANEWTTMYRTDAILRVLVEAGRPVGPAEIAGILKSHGRDDSPHLVSSALVHMKKNTKKAKSAGNGKWLPANAEQGSAVVQFPAPQAPQPSGSPAAASN